MANIRLTIQHGKLLFEPPIEAGVQIEWERTGSPGKLTFTTIWTDDSISFTEGDPVCFQYDGKTVFCGYVFTKKQDREKHIQVTCYDQIRYLKNKYSYVFEQKTATQIIKALCNDFKLDVGSMDDTGYKIPSVAEENKAALDIILTVLEETLRYKKEQYVLYDDCGKLRLKNVKNMLSSSLIMENTAENFDYSSSIDKETYNNVVLYYKNDKNEIQLYTAHSPSTTKQWGTLRYFEEVDTPSTGQTKANSLLQLYNRKTRELKVTGAFGDITVRGGTMIPVRLNFGDIVADNYMLVDKVVHNFDENHHTMDLTLEGAWEDKTTDMVSKTIGTLSPDVVETATDYVTLKVYCNQSNYAGEITVLRTYNKTTGVVKVTSNETIKCDKNTTVEVSIVPYTKFSTTYNYKVSNMSDNWTKTTSTTPSISRYTCKMSKDSHLDVTWMTSEINTMGMTPANDNFLIKKYTLTCMGVLNERFPGNGTISVEYTFDGELKTKEVEHFTKKAFDVTCDGGSTAVVTLTPTLGKYQVTIPKGDYDQLGNQYTFRMITDGALIVTWGLDF